MVLFMLVEGTLCYLCRARKTSPNRPQKNPCFPYILRTNKKKAPTFSRKCLISLVGDTWIEHVTTAV